jgi:hypothetical protein
LVGVSSFSALRASSRNCICARLVLSASNSSSDRGDRGVAGFLGRGPRFLGSVPKRLPLLTDLLQFNPVPLVDRPGLLGEHPELLRLRPARFDGLAVRFGAVALLVRVLTDVVSGFAPMLGLDASRLSLRLVGHNPALPALLALRPLRRAPLSTRRARAGS